MRSAGQEGAQGVEQATRPVASRSHQAVSLVPAALRMVLHSELTRDDLAGVVVATSGTAPLSADDAVQIALLTIYDMCKAVDRGMIMTDVHLLEKHGGKSGSYVAT